MLYWFEAVGGLVAIFANGPKTRKGNSVTIFSRQHINRVTMQGKV